MKNIPSIIIAVIVVIVVRDVYKYMSVKKVFCQAGQRIKTIGVTVDSWQGIFWLFVAAIVLFGEGLNRYHHVLLNFVIGLAFLVRAKMEYMELNSESLFFSKQIIYWKQIQSVEIKKIYIGYLIIIIYNNNDQQKINIRCFSKSKLFFEDYLKFNKIQYSETTEEKCTSH